MTLNYNFPRNASQCKDKQLDFLNQLLHHQRNSQQQFPHLFQNQDSLFNPDHMYSPEDDHQQPRVINFQSKKAHLHNNIFNKNTKDQRIFQEYLDSLDFNQFIQPEENSTKNTKPIELKLNRNGQSQSSLQCTFKPSLSKKTLEIAGHLQPSFERLTMPVRSTSKKIPYKQSNHEAQKRYSKEYLQRLSKPRVLKTQPNQNIQYCKIESQKKYKIPRYSNYLDVAARNQMWEEQKQLKIQKLRKQEEQIKLKKQMSTFTPKLTEYRGEKVVSLSQFGKQGMAHYFQRLTMAKSKISNSYSGKENISNLKKNESSFYCSGKQKTPKRENKKTETNKGAQKIKYDEAVKQLHKKLMSLNI